MKRIEFTRRVHLTIARGLATPGSRRRRAVLASIGVSAALSSSWGCESTEKKDPNHSPAGNILLRDENNYQSTSSLSVPTIETASATDLTICWDEVKSDIQCHDVAPQTDIDNVALLRFLHLSEEQVEAKLTSGQLAQSEVDGYLSFPTDHIATCAKLSQLTFLGTPVDVEEEYVASADQTYMLLFAEGTTPGIGARAMTFLKPTAASVNTRIDAPAGCGMLDFSADLVSAKQVAVSVAGPWIVDWRAMTRDGQGNEVVTESIDGVLIGFYAGMTVAELQAKIMDLELMATSLWEVPPRAGQTADLSRAKERTTGASFPGFGGTQAGVWVLGLMCGGCQNPAPVVLSVLEPKVGGG